MFLLLVLFFMHEMFSMFECFVFLLLFLHDQKLLPFPRAMIQIHKTDQTEWGTMVQEIQPPLE